MQKTIRSLKYACVFLLIALFTNTGCASSRMNLAYIKSKESVCDLSRLGKNSYFYSVNYQRKLVKGTRKNGGR